MEQEHYNPFDELGLDNLEEQKRHMAEQQRLGEKVDQLIHQAFAQNEAGAELLKLWTDTLINIPTARAGDDMLAIGINEGVKSFIRNIHLTIKKVEQGEQ